MTAASPAPSVLRCDTLKTALNGGKAAAIRALTGDWRRLSARIAAMPWRAFVGDGRPFEALTNALTDRRRATVAARGGILAAFALQGGRVHVPPPKVEHAKRKDDKFADVEDAEVESAGDSLEPKANNGRKGRKRGGAPKGRRPMQIGYFSAARAALDLKPVSWISEAPNDKPRGDTVYVSADGQYAVVVNDVSRGGAFFPDALALCEVGGFCGFTPVAAPRFKAPFAVPSPLAHKLLRGALSVREFEDGLRLGAELAAGSTPSPTP